MTESSPPTTLLADASASAPTPVPAAVAVSADGATVRLGQALLVDGAVAVYLETVAGTQIRAETNGNLTVVETESHEFGSNDSARRRAWFGARADTWTVGELPPIELLGDRSPVLAFVVVTDPAQVPAHYLSAHMEQRLAALDGPSGPGGLSIRG